MKKDLNPGGYSLFPGPICQSQFVVLVLNILWCGPPTSLNLALMFVLSSSTPVILHMCFALAYAGITAIRMECVECLC